MANFVLIHGAFHGGWCWSEVSRRLEEAGHTVAAPDLPGAGDDRTPLEDVKLDSAVQRVIETLRSMEGPSVLVGHSMGGVVITQAAARVPELVSRLVYLTAFRPANEESLLDLTNFPEGSGDGVQSNITVDGEPPIATFDLAQASAVFYNGLPDEMAQQATSRLDRQPLSVFATPVDLAAAELPPQEYVVCTQDRAIMPALQRLMAERTPARVHELSAGHSPFYSHPEEVLEILLGAV
ncbi:alpha/beta fold hydrolase [Citricoccus nitrophenolicus]|uniref:alpha/beta fold hydrolase n=1 Tax=Citricoccus nitrophenolicus TaxID=863575 RepID=UPI0039B6BD55